MFNKSINDIQSMRPEELAIKILQAFCPSGAQIPIDPFRLLRESGVIYQFREFDRLEGVYFLPEYEEDVPLVGINLKRPITRQRFTAAHELCHHLKDRRDQLCPINTHGLSTNEKAIERYADDFAAELLMPRKEFAEFSRRFLHDGEISFKDALGIADHFGVSFKSCVLRLSWTFHCMCHGLNYQQICREIRKFKPDKKKAEFGIPLINLTLSCQVIDNYHYPIDQANIHWYHFKNDFIYNENRIEGLKITDEQVAEIVTDLRLRAQKSKYCDSDHQPFIEVAGHSDMYDFIFNTKEQITGFSLLRLNQIFYKYSPHPEAGGNFRTTNNYVAQSHFETLDHTLVPGEVGKLTPQIQHALTDFNSSVSEFVMQCALIHHRITVIHPFLDGNGRVSRAFLNWMFHQRGLPPIYIKLESKDTYFDALSSLDQTQDPNPLCKVLIDQMLLSHSHFYDK